MIHIWHEDSANSATTQFWNFLKQYSVSSIITNADIKGFNSNSKLAEYVSTYRFKSNDTYHIFIDKVVDNEKALEYWKKVKKDVSAYNNVIVHDLLCFEYMILKFKYFVAWTKPVKGNQLYNQGMILRKQFIDCIDKKQPWTRKKDIVNFVVKRFNTDTKHIQYISSENVATALISAMTNGGTIDFGVSKTRLGVCWTCDCCCKHNTSKVGNSKCRLYRYHKRACEKAKSLWNNTYAHKI